MTEDRFEDRLEALFDSPPALDDNLGFALRVEQRIARGARLRADLISAAWIVTGMAVLWAVVSSFDAFGLGVSALQLATAFDADQALGGAWLLPALAVGGVLGFMALEDHWVRD